MSDKDLFFFWNQNGSNPRSIAEMLRQHYQKLSAYYRQQGMKFEADEFAVAAEEFEEIERQMEQARPEKSS